MRAMARDPADRYASARGDGARAARVRRPVAQPGDADAARPRRFRRPTRSRRPSRPGAVTERLLPASAPGAARRRRDRAGGRRGAGRPRAREPARRRGGRDLHAGAPGRGRARHRWPRPPTGAPAKEPAWRGRRSTGGLRAFPEGGTGETLVAGTTEAAGPTLLPARLLADLTAEPGRPDRVRLGQLEAYRYRGLSLAAAIRSRCSSFRRPPASSRPSPAAPPPGRFAAFAPLCEAVAGTLRLSGGNRAVTLGPNASYATAVGSAVEGLNAALPDLRQELADATARSGQADAANRIAAAYSAAGDASARPTARAGGRRPERRPGERAGRGRGLVRSNSPPLRRPAMRRPTRRPARQIAGTEGDVRDALEALRRAGYEVAAP